MTTESAITRARRLKHAIALAVGAFVLLTTLAFAPSADAQIIDVSGQWEVVTKPCLAPYVAWPGGIDGTGQDVCYNNFPANDDCPGTVDGRSLYRDEEPSVGLLGCYYYPGITIQRTYAAPAYTFAPLTPSSGSPSTWTFGF